ncbi:hypothetical protein BN946_scf185033.g25 [Trametes cinnabarina]|uniref:F-box domain-containing protein n=1 Tax=Pycnoporus cinnabarinus TaxID=5643 RepID=A0A060SWH7_PYCCI|nr:hypothetical protein BN946_scf185033.g25 [Trametes cinnabarina]
MPVDIVTEIFSYLDPLDLLNLVRTSKSLRKFLLNPRLAYTWEVVRKSVRDIPPPPPFMSEPAFIHLVFSTYCHGCGKGPVHKIVWIWFVRYCKDCAQEQRGNVRDDTLREFQLFDRDTLWNKCNGKFTDFLNVICPCEWDSYTRKRNIYHVPQLQDFVNAWNAAESPDARVELYEEHKAEVAIKAKHAKTLEKWWEGRKRDRLDELEAIRRQRFSDVCDRLTEAGWGAEVDRLRSTEQGRRSLVSVPGVRQPSTLTDKAFGSVLRHAEGMLAETRELIVKKARQAKLRQKLQLFESAIAAYYVRTPRTARMLCRAQVSDLRHESEITSLLLSPTMDALKLEDFATLVPTLAQRWEEKVKDRMRAVVRSAVEGIPDDTDPLELAVAAFSCPRCRDAPLRYPEILVHSCLRSQSGRPQTDDKYTLDIYELSFDMHYSRQPFQYDRISDTLVLTTNDLMVSLGLSPTTMTWDELVNGDLRFRYVERRCSARDCGLYKWAAALHTLRRNRRGGWRMATDEELQAGSQIPIEPRAALLDGFGRYRWCCALCPQDWYGYRAEAKKHLWNRHNLEDVDRCVADGTLFIHPSETNAEHTLQLPDPPDTPDSTAP